MNTPAHIFPIIAYSVEFARRSYPQKAAIKSERTCISRVLLSDSWPHTEWIGPVTEWLERCWATAVADKIGRRVSLGAVELLGRFAARREEARSRSDVDVRDEQPWFTVWLVAE